MPTAPSLGTHGQDHSIQLCPRVFLQAFLRAGLLFNLPLGLTMNRIKPLPPSSTHSEGGNAAGRTEQPELCFWCMHDPGLQRNHRD